MPVSPLDEKTLQNFNYFRDYQHHRQEFLDLARTLYVVTYRTINSPPQEQQCEALYKDVLLGTTLFADLCARKQMVKPNDYALFAEILARYVINKDWGSISGPLP